MHVCRTRAKRADVYMARSHLYRGQGLLLLFLARQDGLTHSEIAEKLNISPAAATKVIKRLERLGFLQRQADEQDERVSRVYLQPTGREVMDAIQQSFQVLDEQSFQGFSAAEQEQLRGFLQRILENLDALPAN